MKGKRVKQIQQILTKRWVVLVILTLLFLAMRLPVLFTFEGILGGHETFEIGTILSYVVKGDISVFQKTLQDYAPPYNYLITLLQIPFTLPFYLMFPTNQFSSFLGTLTTSILTLICAFLFVDKLFNRKTAVFMALLFIFTPIGLTISSISSESTGKNLIMLVMIPFFLLFFSKKSKHRLWSMPVLAFLPLITPYHLILWPCTAIYLILENYCKNKTKKVEWKKFTPYLKRFILWVLILSPLFFLVYISITGAIIESKPFETLEQVKIFLPTIDRLKAYTYYITQPFVVDNVTNLKRLSIITYAAFALFLVMSISATGYFIKKAKDQQKVKPILFFAIYPIIFVVTDILFSNKFTGFINRPLSIRSYYLKLVFFILIIVISYFITHKKHFNKVLYGIFILNIIVNFSTITSLNINNNFINYNIGYEYNWKAFETLKKYEGARFEVYDSINRGLYSRVMDPYRIREVQFLDYRLYGYGMSQVYDNELGSNLCNNIMKNKGVELCKQGYSMTEGEIKYHLQKNQRID